MDAHGTCASGRSPAKRRRADDDDDTSRRPDGWHVDGGVGGGSSTIATVRDHEHAMNLLSCMESMRHRGELCDLVLSPGRGGAPVCAHAVVMAAASPFIHSKITRWRDARGEAGDMSGQKSPSASSSVSSSSSPSSSSSSSSSSSATSTEKNEWDQDVVEIVVPDMEASALVAAVDFAYTGTLRLDTAHKVKRPGRGVHVRVVCPLFLIQHVIILPSRPHGC